MAFPTHKPGFPDQPLEPGDVYQPEGSSKAWYWDGSKWVLSSNSNVGAQVLNDLGDARTDNQPAKSGDLLSWNDTTKEFHRKDASQVINENDAFVKELDDLLDVNIEESKHVVGTKFNYYTNSDPTKPDGYGRYSVNTLDRTITINRVDLDGQDASALASQVTLSGSVGHIITFEYGTTEQYSATTRIMETPTVSTNGAAFTFKYNNEEIIRKIAAAENEGKLMFSIATNEFRGLADGAVLMYKERTGQQWEPAFN